MKTSPPTGARVRVAALNPGRPGFLAVYVGRTGTIVSKPYLEDCLEGLVRVDFPEAAYPPCFHPDELEVVE